VNKTTVIGWIVSFSGMALWLYRYYVTGHPSVINWEANTPWWIADIFPNVESEIGMALAFVALIPIYWPDRRR
jgi:hypothetical protein